MTVATKKLLHDVREAGESILQNTKGRTLAEYSADRFFRRAVEREFEIIGEALNRLDRLAAPTAASFPDFAGYLTPETASFTATTPWMTRWFGASWSSTSHYS